ncbi:MAG TPA: phenylalanine--tRNA ligase subunit beta [Desulfobacteraceae bacterium]|nr:phenylalanine--tRNA ligase subunit beta [Desulfobacteraceae bacterium]
MKTNLHWLKEFVDIQMDVHELAHMLTMTGLEVETIDPLDLRFDKIVVGLIKEVRQHPEADRLFVCDVDAGKKSIQVVCGAPNTEAGMKAPLALPGAVLADGRKVREGKIRGVISAGVLLAEDELGLTDDHSGIMILDHDWPTGTELSELMPRDDWIMEIGITPNRPDCASVIGIAREIAAVTGGEIRMPSSKPREEGPDVESLASISLLDPKGCPRYVARVIQGARLGPSPFWMRYRLHLGGIRSINNVVDVTNYVLLELGQPLHAFDYDRLRGHKIEVRRAEAGERFTTLDGQTRELSEEVLLICDAERPVAIAGIMGGLNSEIFEGTQHVLLESAFFDPRTIRRGAKHLGLSTEASYRFERGADIGGVVRAADRAAYLIQEIAGGKVAKGILDEYPERREQPVIELRISETNKVLGTGFNASDVARCLRSLEMEVESKGEDTLQVVAPTYRVDILREIDLIEEVARMGGYQNIPVRTPSVRASEEERYWELDLSDRVRWVMASMGYTEVITYGFISPRVVEALGAAPGEPLMNFVRLLNPLTLEQSVMRTSLLPGLLVAAKQNLSYGEKSLKLFEWGRVFFSKGTKDLPEEKYQVAALLSGPVSLKKWYTEERKADFYDIKGAVEALLENLGVEGFRFKGVAEFPAYNPEASADIEVGDAVLGHVGVLHNDVKERLDLGKSDFFAFELHVDAVRSVMTTDKKFTPFARFPAVHRDISIVVAKDIESLAIERLIKEEGGRLIESIEIFDVYEGKGISPNEKALGFRICYRSTERTLDGEEVNILHERIIDRIREQTGGRLR